MKLPRDLSGDELANLLVRWFGYEVVRTRGSHMNLVLNVGDKSHSVTIPRHRELRIGTLDGIVGEVARFAGTPKGEVRETLFC